jgi:hypothetical protein
MMSVIPQRPIVSSIQISDSQRSNTIHPRYGIDPGSSNNMNHYTYIRLSVQDKKNERLRKYRSSRQNAKLNSKMGRKQSSPPKHHFSNHRFPQKSMRFSPSGNGQGQAQFVPFSNTNLQPQIQPYMPTSPSYCDNVPVADYSSYQINDLQPYTRSMILDSSSRSVGKLFCVENNHGTHHDRYHFNKNMDELREAYKRFAAKHFARTKKTAVSRSRTPTKKAHHLSHRSTSTTSVDIGRLAYDPRQPQYSPSYDPDPFHNEREYSPYFSEW